MYERHEQQEVALQVAETELHGTLVLPARTTAIVLFVHGSGSSRFSPRNRAVAARLHARGFATLLLDLLTEEEEREDALGGALRFAIPLLAARVAGAVDWVEKATLGSLPIGLFGASTGAAAALVADALAPGRVHAIVSRGGRPDLAGEALARVAAPTLLLVGSLDPEVLAWNRQALARLHAPAELQVIPGASHLFEEAGTLDVVAERAAQWFEGFLVPAAGQPVTLPELAATAT